MHIFLDLEDTVIAPVLNGWSNAELINFPKIKFMLEELNPTYHLQEVSIFSFAIHNDYELSHFNTFVAPALRKELGITAFSRIPTVDGAIRTACARSMRLHSERIDFSDLVDFWGKGRAFQDYIRYNYDRPNCVPQTFVLIDDAVQNETLILPNKNKVRTIRISND